MTQGLRFRAARQRRQFSTIICGSARALNADGPGTARPLLLRCAWPAGMLQEALAAFTSPGLPSATHSLRTLSITDRVVAGAGLPPTHASGPAPETATSRDESDTLASAHEAILVRTARTTLEALPSQRARHCRQTPRRSHQACSTRGLACYLLSVGLFDLHGLAAVPFCHAYCNQDLIPHIGSAYRNAEALGWPLKRPCLAGKDAFGLTCTITRQVFMLLYD